MNEMCNHNNRWQQTSIPAEADNNQRIPLRWTNGEERPWKEIVEDEEKVGWNLDFHDALITGMQLLDPTDARLARVDDSEIRLMVDPLSIIARHLSSVYPLDAAVAWDLVRRLTEIADDVAYLGRSIP